MTIEYLIIGNSTAGINAAEAIRETNNTGKVTIISDERIVNYSRPLISHYLGGKITEEKMIFRDREFYSDNRIELQTGRKAVSINPGRKTIVLSDNTKIKFDKLLIATGGEPIVPPIEGKISMPGIFTFTKYDDARQMLDYMKKNKVKQAVVLGAGLIGLKCTEGLLAQGITVSIVELADRVLANTFDRAASEILEKELMRNGCRVLKNDTIVRVEKSAGKFAGAVLKTGRKLKADMLVIAIGVVPRIGLAKGTQIKTSRGIIVNDRMQTSVRDIYAAGDVAQAADFLSGGKSVTAIWPVAARQGRVAGYNMAGKSTEYSGSFAMNSVELAGIPTISFGLTNPPESPEYEVLVRTEPENRFYRKIVLKNNRIVGFITLGRIERAGIFLGLIRERLNVSSYKNSLLSDSFGFLLLPSEYRKHLVTGNGIEV